MLRFAVSTTHTSHDVRTGFDNIREIIKKQLLNVTESELLSCGQYFSSTPYHQKRLCSIHERLISGLEKQCFKDFGGFLKVFRFIVFLNFLNFIKRF